MRALGDVTIVAPCNLWEAAEATEAVARVAGTTYLRLDKSHARQRLLAKEPFQLGKARTVRPGSDLTLAAIGGVAEVAWLAAEQLARDGIETRVLHLHSLRPLDTEALARAATETGGLITIEEHTVDGGLGGAVAEYLLESGNLPGCFHRIGLRGGLSSIVGSQDYLRAQFQIDVRTIVAKVAQWFNEGRLRPRTQAA